MLPKFCGLFSRTTSRPGFRKAFHNDPRQYPGREHAKVEGLYQIPELFKSHGIPYSLWLEDVLVAYGSDTQVWELSLLVEDPPSAARVLFQAGYTVCPPATTFIDDQEFAGRGICLYLPLSESKTTLYPAKEWHFNLKPGLNELPPLNEFIGSLMDSWSNISLKDYVDLLPFALYIYGLITYCYGLEDPQYGPVKSTDYASHLQKEHQGLHFNIVSADPKSKFASTSSHTYHARKYNKIKSAEWTPQTHQPRRYRSKLPALDELSSSIDSYLVR